MRAAGKAAGAVLAVTTILALGACGGMRARSAAPTALPPTAAAGVAAPGPGAPAPADAGTAALNSKLLSQLSPSGGGDDLPIGPGDLIEVSVFEVQELSNLKVRVPLRGSVTLPLIGAVPAAGSTTQELQEQIRSRLQARYMHDPQISVFLLEQRSQRVSVFGSVRQGGVFPMTSEIRLADALGLAQGLTDDADHVVYLIRRVPAGTVALAQAGGVPPRPALPPLPGAETEEVMAAIDLDALANGRQELNVPLQAGDVIQVPRAGSYYVGGEVEHGGSFFLKAKTTLQQAVTTAGGVTSKAAWSDIRIYRAKSDGEREVLTFDLSKIEKGDSAAPEIQKNDVVVVGKSYAKAFFFGVTDLFKGLFGFSKGI